MSKPCSKKLSEIYETFNSPLLESESELKSKEACRGGLVGAQSCVPFRLIMWLFGTRYFITTGKSNSKRALCSKSKQNKLKFKTLTAFFTMCVNVHANLKNHRSSDLRLCVQWIKIDPLFSYWHYLSQTKGSEHPNLKALTM